MTPRWLTVEKLVAELGEACASRYELAAAADAEVAAGTAVERAMDEATDAVTAVLRSPGGNDEIVGAAWIAIAQAHDSIARLRKAIERGRDLREQAQKLILHRVCGPGPPEVACRSGTSS
ncbi:MAG: hypothetical protein DMF78_12560 [Acidobacteria bacterium]|nr:MAG: hypothetical protein DMF78_12560 [Acidobacteriota bacterium]